MDVGGSSNKYEASKSANRCVPDTYLGPSIPARTEHLALHDGREPHSQCPDHLIHNTLDQALKSGVRAEMERWTIGMTQAWNEKLEVVERYWQVK